MKLRTFDKTITKTVSPGECSVTVNPKGTVFFSVGLVKVMQLEPGDRVLFHQDQENRSDWYIEKTKSIAGFEVKNYKTAGVSAVQSVNLVRLISKSTGQAGSARYPVSEKPYKWGESNIWLMVSKSNPILSL
jgi:hypothetical protein